MNFKSLAIKAVSGSLCALVMGVSTASAQNIVLTAGTESNEDGLYYRTLTLLEEQLKRKRMARLGCASIPINS